MTPQRLTLALAGTLPAQPVTFEPGFGREKLRRAKQALCATIFGYDDEMEHMLLCLVAGGHVATLGDPGTAKTRSMKALARVLRNSVYRRVQMVPDLMPADILGTEAYDKETGKFSYLPGPLNPHVNLFHADEINRTPPKTQSALLEAMEEGQFSVAGCTSNAQNTYRLHDVFMVLATENPIDMIEGTYPLPSAQLDRFAVQLLYGRLSREDEYKVVRKTAFDRHGLSATDAGVIGVEEIPAIRRDIENSVHCLEHAYRYAHDLVFATRPTECPAALKGLFIRGVSVRPAQWALQLARVRAYMYDRTHIAAEDIKFVMPAVLRHRLYIAEEKRLRGWDTEKVLEILLKEVPIPTTI